MNSTQIISIIGASVIFLFGIIFGTLLIIHHRACRILSNRFGYGIAFFEYIGGIFGAYLVLYYGFRG
jgi:hypothetical protein